MHTIPGRLKLHAFTIFLLLFVSTVQGGDEPAPVVYMDPETGELRVQNPPKLSREHDIPNQVVADSSTTPAQQVPDKNRTLLIGGVLLSVIIFAAGWAFWRKKSSLQ